MIYLVITPFFPSNTSFRGPYIYDQVQAIKAISRYDVVVLKPEPWYNSVQDYEYDGIQVHCFSEYDLPSAAWPGMFNTFNIVSFKRCLKRLGIHIEEIRVVHAHVAKNAFYANYIKKCNSQTRTILQHHGFDILGITNGKFAQHNWHKHLVIRYGTRLCSKIDLHVGVSQATISCLKNYPNIQVKNSYVLYNGVDTRKFYPEYHLKNTEIFHIGCIANFGKIKDQITLIKAIELLIKKGYSNIKVSFIGSGPTLKECMQYVNSQNINTYFTFKKEVDHKLLRQFYNTLDLFVLPSYWDAFGCVYLEAYACGIPFMACKESGIAEYLPESEAHKWLIKPHDYQQLAKNINNYINHPIEQHLRYAIDIRTLIANFLDII